MKNERPSAPRCYLVTGVAGFIASRVAEMLLAEGHTVVGVDNLNDYYDVRLKDYRLSRLLDKSSELGGSDPKRSAFANNKQPLTHDRFEFRVLDIENSKELDELFATRKFDAVFNLAARAGVRYSLENPRVYLSTNVLGTLNLLECQRKHGVRKQVLASTSSLYAGCPMPFTEDQPVNTPLSPYAATKKAAELMACSYHQLHGLDITVVRYFTVFGPAGRPDMAPLRFIKWIDEGTPITLYGDGTQARDFTYVDDIARGTILAGKLFGGQMKPETGNLKPEGSESKSGLRSQASGLSGGLKPAFEIINLGGGNNPISLTTVIGMIEQALGKKAKISGQPPSPADMKETWADISKAKQLLNWEPKISPEEGFRRTVSWHVENRGWLKGIQL